MLEALNSTIKDSACLSLVLTIFIERNLEMVWEKDFLSVSIRSQINLLLDVVESIAKFSDSAAFRRSLKSKLSCFNST